MAESKGHSAVRAMKRARLSDGEPWQKLELFPTPPWATRALFKYALPVVCSYPFSGRATQCVEDPAAGLGHLSEVLKEFVDRVIASDVFIYPLQGGGDTRDFGIERRDFLESFVPHNDVDWIVTNPPFVPAARFLFQALLAARRGVALLLRIQWLEGAERYSEIYAQCPPSLVAPFVERVPMCEGGYDPEGSTATMYAWFIWVKDVSGHWPGVHPSTWNTFPTFLIPPGCKDALTRPEDLILAQRCVPGFIPPSKLKKTGKGQGALVFDGGPA